jgi:hypothetical protein
MSGLLQRGALGVARSPRGCGTGAKADPDLRSATGRIDVPGHSRGNGVRAVRLAFRAVVLGREDDAEVASRTTGINAATESNPSLSKVSSLVYRSMQLSP